MEFADALKQIIFFEKALESSKIDLALKHDFNLIDAFKLFDRQQIGCFTPDDFAYGLRNNLQFGDFNNNDIYLLFKRVDTQNYGRISFKQFSAMVVPMHPEYASRVTDRPEYFSKRGTEFRFFFCRETRQDLHALLRAIFNAEREMESICQSLKQNLKLSFN
jgi:hypothetical protein